MLIDLAVVHRSVSAGIQGSGGQRETGSLISNHLASQGAAGESNSGRGLSYPGMLTSNYQLNVMHVPAAH